MVSGGLPVKDEFRTPPHERLKGLPAEIIIPLSVSQEITAQASAEYPNPIVGVLLGERGVVTKALRSFKSSEGNNSEGESLLLFLATYGPDVSKDDLEITLGFFSMKWKQPPPVLGMYYSGRFFGTNTLLMAKARDSGLFNNLIQAPGLFGVVVDMHVFEAPDFSALRYDADLGDFESIFLNYSPG